MISVGQKIIKNTVLNVAGNVLQILSGFILIPIIISKIGVDLFGLWAMVATIYGIVELLDLGFGTSFIKFQTEAITTGDYAKLSRIVSIGVQAYAVFILILSCCLYPSLTFVIEFIGLAPLGPVARQVILIGLATFTVQNFGLSYQSLLISLQRYDLTNALRVAHALLRLSLSIMALHLGYGVIGLVLVQLSVTILHNVSVLLIVNYLLPELRFRIGTWDRNLLRSLFDFGWQVQLGRTSRLLNLQLDKLILSKWFGITFVGYYEMGAKIANFLRVMARMFSSATMPLASELSAQLNYDLIRSVYRSGTKLLVALSMFMTTFMLMFSDELLYGWIGQTLPDASIMLRILSVGIGINIGCYLALHMSNGMGKPEFEMKYGVTLLALNIVLSGVGALTVGKFGAAIGTSTSSLIAGLSLMAWFQHHLQIGWHFLLKLFLLPLALSVPLIALLWLARLMIPGWLGIDEANRWWTVFQMALFLVSGFVIYFQLLLVTNYFSRSEKLKLSLTNITRSLRS